MKVFLLINFLITSSILNVYSQDFRTSKWGDSKAQVLVSEKTKPSEITDDGVHYTNKSLLSRPCDYSYSFKDGKLYAGLYILNSIYINSNNYISEYEKLKESIITKYGKPYTDELEWNNDRYKNNPDHYGLAVSSGYLKYKSTWKTDRTIIVLMLTGENFKLYNTISYFDINYINEYKPDTEGL